MNETNTNFEENRNLEEDLRFSDDEGNIYLTYLRLDHIRIQKPEQEKASDLVLSISKEDFPLKDYSNCFEEKGDSILLDLTKLLGIKDRLQSQVLTFVLKGKREKTTRIVFLNRYFLLKDPRKKENSGHMSVLLNTLVLDYVYSTDGMRSNLKVKLDGKSLYFLLDERKPKNG